jgi:tetratricopeptide (TPR) repeat protein
MRALLLAPLTLLLAPAAVPALDQTEATGPSLHTLCGGDLVTPGTARVLPGYGSGGMLIATQKTSAQVFFDNGLQLSHAFAHKAGLAAFQEASRLDPTCAMCAWGEAWAMGPTINYPIKPDEQAKAAKRVEAAEKLAATAPVKERQLVAALALRYKNGGGKGKGDLAYAQAMDDVAKMYPQDNEVATLAADAWMIPFAQGGNKGGNLPRAVELLEGVLKRDPDFTPAIHFYIHATEMSSFPARAEPFANRLATLAPAASHLVHMPSHTFYWVDRYQDAADANVRAAAIDAADAKVAKLPEPDGIYQLTYHAHNVQFGIGGALVAGDAKSALALSAPIIAAVAHMPKGPGYYDMAAGTGYFAEGRFADPDTVLALPEVPADHPFLRAYRHYARGEAYARKGDAAGVRAEAIAIPMRVPGIDPKKDDSAPQAVGLMRVARLVLMGRAAMLEKRPDRAAKFYTAAARIEESPLFKDWTDPPSWWYPVRRSLASALLAQGKAKEALVEADAALKRRPRDPVTLALRGEIEAALAGKPVATQALAYGRKRMTRAMI